PPDAPHPRRLAVHRGRVEQVRAGSERGVDDLAPLTLRALTAHVERLPRAHADHRDGEAARTEGTLFHGRSDLSSREHGSAVRRARLKGESVPPRRSGTNRTCRAEAPIPAASAGRTAESARTHRARIA